MITILISSLVVIFCVYLGVCLNKRAGTKKDKEEAQHIFSILQDEIKSNLDNNLNKDFSSESLSVLGKEVFKVKMGVLATHQKEHLGCFIKIYGQFNNINKALSNYIELEQGRNPSKKIRAYEEIVQLRSSCKEDIKTYLKKTCE